jgi:hypothetical protein
VEARVLDDELIDIRSADELLEPDTALVQGVGADPLRAQDRIRPSGGRRSKMPTTATLSYAPLRIGGTKMSQ